MIRQFQIVLYIVLEPTFPNVQTRNRLFRLLNEFLIFEIDGIRYDDKYVFDDVGYNFMASDISAAFALCRLKKLKGNLKKRIRNFKKLYFINR